MHIHALKHTYIEEVSERERDRPKYIKLSLCIKRWTDRDIENNIENSIAGYKHIFGYV